MRQYILVAIVLLAGVAGISEIGKSTEANKVLYGVFDGMGIAAEGRYYLIEGKTVKTPVNATIIQGKFILWGGYLINGTEVRPKRMVAAVVTNNVIVVSGNIQVLAGEVQTLGNYTVVRGNPARVLIIDGRVYYPQLSP